MKVLKSHLTIYYIFGFLYFLSTIMDWILLSYVAKPLFIGAVFFYYIEEKQTSVNYYYCLVLFFLFCSAIINLLEGYSYFIYVLFFNFLAYCILFFLLIKRLVEKRHHKIEKEHSLQLLLMLIFLSCFLYISYYIVFDRSFEFYKVILLYGFILTAFAMLATYRYLTEASQKNMFLLFYAIDVVICEIFYIIYHYYFSFALVRFVSVFCYILSFYFLANYFLKENNYSIKR